MVFYGAVFVLGGGAAIIGALLAQRVLTWRAALFGILILSVIISAAGSIMSLGTARLKAADHEQGR